MSHGCVHSHFIEMKNRAITKCECIFPPNERSLTWTRNRLECCWLAKFYNMDFEPIAIFFIFFVEISNSLRTQYPHRLSHTIGVVHNTRPSSNELGAHCGPKEMSNSNFNLNEQVLFAIGLSKDLFILCSHTYMVYRTICFIRFDTPLFLLSHLFFFFFLAVISFFFYTNSNWHQPRIAKHSLRSWTTVHSHGGWSTRFVGVSVFVCLYECVVCVWFFS